MMKVIFCTLMGLRVGCRISGLSGEFPLSTVYKLVSSTATPKKERMHLQMDSIITTWLLLFAVKEHPHWVSEVYRFPTLATKCHKRPSFWHKPEEECSQARTCPLWKVAPGKSVGLFALQCYQCVHVVWWVYASFACVFKQHLAHTSHNSHSWDSACLQTADRDSACPPPSWDEAGGMLGFG